MRLRVVPVAFVAAILVATTATSANADPIADAKAQAKRIAAQIDSLQAQAEKLAEDYNDTANQLAQLDKTMAQTKARLDQNQAVSAQVEQRMTSWAVKAYMHASDSDPLLSVLAGDSGESSGADGYTDIAVGKDASLADQLRQKRQDVGSVASDLANQSKLAALLKATLAKKKAAAAQATTRQESLLASTNDQLKTLIKAEQERQAELERQQVQAEIEARRLAKKSATAGPAAAAAVHHTPPPASPGAAGAIAQAMSQLGVLYRWGQDDPAAGFDCSGLVSWAWGRVGRDLPRSSRSQWESLPHVDPEDLEPGDLVFFGNPVHHVGLYIGNGEMIHSPQSGDVVKIATIYRRDLRGGGRP